MTDKKNSKPGPTPERVKTDKNWEDAIPDALKKKRPKDGWPKPEKDKRVDNLSNPVSDNEW